MVVYFPTLSGDALSSGPGATGFFVEDPAREGEIPPVLIQNKDIPEFVQGQRFEDSDMVLSLLRNSMRALSPHKVTYSVGPLISEVFTPLGPRDREPREIRIGKYAPMIQVGDSWAAGDYLVRWSIQETTEDTPKNFDMLFRILSSGISSCLRVLPNFVDVSATVLIEGVTYE